MLSVRHPGLQLRAEFEPAPELLNVGTYSGTPKSSSGFPYQDRENEGDSGSGNRSGAKE